jgi:hypothetical protein
MVINRGVTFGSGYTCWYHQLGPVYTVKRMVYASKAKFD